MLLVAATLGGCSPSDNRQIALDTFSRAGASQDTLRRVDCIMYRESRYYSDRQHRNTNGTYDSGLFQINQIHADRWRRVTGKDYWQTWRSPWLNSRVAVDIWRSAGLSPWGGGCYL